MSKTNKDFWNGPLTGSRIKSEGCKLPEMLIGYFIGPFGALLASGIFYQYPSELFYRCPETEPDISDNFTAVLDHSDRSSKPDRRSAY